MKTAYAVGILVILAIAIIAVVGLQVMKSPATSTTTTTTNGGIGVSISESASASGGSGGTSTSSSSGSSGSGTGNFAMGATDPPVAASGVTAATATYDDLAVHTAGSSNATGWTDIQGTGTINLMSSANVSQTIAAAKIATGTYDMVRMGIQSASVTYQGKVYAAAVASDNITSRLQSNAQVTSSQSTAAVVDLRTFIINAANSSQPQFVFSACAKSTTVPPSSTTSASFQVGGQTNLQGSWWVGFNDQTSTKVTITSATLTSGSLNLQLSNSGNSSAQIQTVVITPVSVAGTITAQTMPNFSGSAIFTANGGQLQASNSLQVAALLGGSGTNCSAGSSSSLSYSGNISLGFGVVGIQLTGIVSGQQYLVTVMGPNTYGSLVVTAQ